ESLNTCNCQQKKKRRESKKFFAALRCLRRARWGRSTSRRRGSSPTVREDASDAGAVPFPEANGVIRHFSITGAPLSHPLTRMVPTLAPAYCPATTRRIFAQPYL